MMLAPADVKMIKNAPVMKNRTNLDQRFVFLWYNTSIIGGNMKRIKYFMGIIISLAIFIPTLVYAVPEKPPGSLEGSNTNTSSNISYKGATSISSSLEENK